MIEALPSYVNLVFVAACLFAVMVFYKAAQYSRRVLAVVLSWLCIQRCLGWAGFYTVREGFPPRFILLGLPPVLLIIALLTSTKGRLFIDSLDMKYLTYLHAVRVSVRSYETFALVLTAEFTPRAPENHAFLLLHLRPCTVPVSRTLVCPTRAYQIFFSKLLCN